jgi:glutamine phosphoribosylpyrophosphate amidotransferase
MKDIEALADVFTTMLLLSEHRGPYATGVAWVKKDGTMQVAKEPLPARQFVQTGTYLDWLCGVDRQVTYLMGHTRWPSRGSVRNPDNNHPLVISMQERNPIMQDRQTSGQASKQIGSLALTHNGTVAQPEYFFSQMRLPRTAQVDSELLARIAQRHTDERGIDVEGFLDALSPLDGSMSVALVATSRPDEIVLLKGNMPLEIRMHRRKRVVLYASESRILAAALGDDAGWENIPLAPGEALAINTTAIHTPRRYRFSFQGMARQTAWDRFTGA